MRILYTILVVFSASIISCNSNTNNATSSKEQQAPAPVVTPSSKLGADDNTKLVNMLNNYYALKDALVATSGDKATTAAKMMINGLDSFKAGVEKTDAVILPSINNYLDTIKTELGIIAGYDVKKINDIRMHFAKISGPMFTLCKKLELKNSGLYLQHCPMAFDDTGANWLSNYSEIKNPYYGDKMLECGEIEDSLK